MALATVPYGDTPGVADLPFDPRASFDPRTFPAPAATRPTIGRLRLPQPPLGARCLEVGFSLRVGGDVEAEASQCDVLDVPLLPRPRKLRLRSRSAAPAPLPARPTPVRRSPRAPPPHTSSSAASRGACAPLPPGTLAPTARPTRSPPELLALRGRRRGDVGQPGGADRVARGS